MSFTSFMLTSDLRTHHRDAIEDSESTRVARKFEEQEKATKIVANNDGSKSTSSKQESPVVSAILGAACIAAVAFEAATESQRKERSERYTEVKREDRNDVVYDRDSTVGTGPARSIEGNQPLTIEQNVAANRTVQQTVVAAPKTMTVTPAAVTLGETQTEIRHNRYLKSDVVCPTVYANVVEVLLMYRPLDSRRAKTKNVSTTQLAAQVRLCFDLPLYSCSQVCSRRLSCGCPNE